MESESRMMFMLTIEVYKVEQRIVLFVHSTFFNQIYVNTVCLLITIIPFNHLGVTLFSSNYCDFFQTLFIFMLQIKVQKSYHIWLP